MIVATVPISVVPLLRYKTLPTANSVVNDVPTPVTFLLPAVTEIVPVLLMGVHVAAELQFPFALLVIVDAFANETVNNNMIPKAILNFKSGLKFLDQFLAEMVLV
jgi:hypothetical protein